MSTSINAIAAKLLAVQKKMKPLEVQLGKLKTQEDALREKLAIAMKKSKADSWKGTAGHAYFSKQEFFTITNYKKVMEYVFKKKDPAVFTKKLNSTHIRELANDGVKVPGTKKESRQILNFKGAK